MTGDNIKTIPAPLLFTAAALVFICAGCSTVREDIHDGLVEKHYISPFAGSSSPNVPVPATLRVVRIAGLPPATPPDVLPPWKWAVALTPGVSLLLPPFVERNTFRQSSINDWSSGDDKTPSQRRPLAENDSRRSGQDVRTVYRMGPDELATILTKEIEKNGVVADVHMGGSPADFDLRGTVNFILETSFCTYGLGLFAGFAYLPGLPILRETGRCEARFQVVSRDGTTTLLDKTYDAQRSWKTTLYHLELPAMPAQCGQVLFPDIVLKLMIDLLNIPPEKWKGRPQSGRPATQR